jgi:hypothetical protein
MSQLETYYNEHATHARQHEDHRERMTAIVLTFAGVLIGLVTFAGLSLTALPAAISLVVLGIFGLLASGKHYERFRMHTTVMETIRNEMDRVASDPGVEPKSLSSLRIAGETKHYDEFSWPWASEATSDRQANAKAWIARRRTRFFWELIHVGVAVIGLAICSAIVYKSCVGRPSPGGGKAHHESPSHVAG